MSELDLTTIREGLGGLYEDIVGIFAGGAALVVRIQKQRLNCCWLVDELLISQPYHLA